MARNVHKLCRSSTVGQCMPINRRTDNGNEMHCNIPYIIHVYTVGRSQVREYCIRNVNIVRCTHNANSCLLCEGIVKNAPFSLAPRLLEILVWNSNNFRFASSSISKCVHDPLNVQKFSIFLVFIFCYCFLLCGVFSCSLCLSLAVTYIPVNANMCASEFDRQ